MAFANEDVQGKFEGNATELLRFLITTAGKVFKQLYILNFIFRHTK
jgi:hypothetical protein